jgi:hypothetical protein
VGATGVVFWIISCFSLGLGGGRSERVGLLERSVDLTSEGAAAAPTLSFGRCVLKFEGRPWCLRRRWMRDIVNLFSVARTFVVSGSAEG